MASILLSVGATGAKTSERFNLVITEVPATISAPALAGSEVVDLHIAKFDGTTFLATGLQLTASENTKTITGPGSYKTVKSTTVAAVEVTLHKVNKV